MQVTIELPSQQWQVRGDEWLIFRVHQESSLNSRKKSSNDTCQARTLSRDLVLDAIMPSSQFLIQFSPTIQVRCSLALPFNPFRPLQLSAPTVEHSITISSAYLAGWRTLVLPNNTKISIASEKLVQEIMARSSVYLAPGQEFIMIEESRAKMVLYDWKRRIENKSAWHTPLALGLALFATLTTSSFTDQSWASKGTLKGFFLFCFFGSLVWLGREFYRAKRSQSTSVDEFVADMKRGTERIGVETGVQDTLDTPQKK
jgi:hypothetical protein